MKTGEKSGSATITYPLPVTRIDYFASREEWEDRWYRPGNLMSDFESLLHCGFTPPVVPSHISLSAGYLQEPNAPDMIEQIVHYFGVASESLRIGIGTDRQLNSRPILEVEADGRIGLTQKAYRMLITHFFKEMARHSSPFLDAGDDLWWMLFFFNTDKVVKSMMSLLPASKGHLFPYRLGFSDGGSELASTRDALCAMVKTMYALEAKWSKDGGHFSSPKDDAYCALNVEKIRELKPWMARVLNSVGRLAVLKPHMQDSDTRKALWTLVYEDHKGKAREVALRCAASKGDKAAEMLLVHEAIQAV